MKWTNGFLEKNPKETGVLEKHNTKVSLWE
jgi:hypothetical protein